MFESVEMSNVLSDKRIRVYGSLLLSFVVVTGLKSSLIK